MGEFFMAIPRFGGLIAAEIFKKSYNYGRKKARKEIESERKQREFDEKVAMLEKEAYRISVEIVNKTKLKKHFVLPSEVISRELEYINDDVKYKVVVRPLEMLHFNGYLFGERNLLLTTSYDYYNCNEGDVVDVHCYLRFDGNGALIQRTFFDDEPKLATLENCRERFLSTP